MKWYFGPDNGWSPRDLAENDFASDLIDLDVFKDYNHMANYLAVHAGNTIEVTSTEDGQGYFDTTFVMGGATFNLMTISPVGDIIEEE